MSWEEFEDCLVPVIDDRDSMKIGFSIGNHSWIVLINNMRLDCVMFGLFLDALDLHLMDYIFISVSVKAHAFVVVLDRENAVERICGLT